MAMYLRSASRSEGVDVDDVGVVQPGGAEGFLFESGEVGGVGQQVGLQDLQRDGAIEAELARQIDFTHAAASQESLDLEVAQGAAGKVAVRAAEVVPRWLGRLTASMDGRILRVHQITMDEEWWK